MKLIDKLDNFKNKITGKPYIKKCKDGCWYFVDKCEKCGKKTIVMDMSPIDGYYEMLCSVCRYK